MLKIIQQAIPRGNPKIPSDWIKFVDDMNNRTDGYRTRFMLSHPVHTPLLNVISSVINQLDHTILKTKTSGIGLYTEVTKHLNTIERTIDPYYIGVSDNGPFVGNNRDTINYCLRTTVANPLLTLPIDSGWERWEDVKPLRVLYHNSPELLYDFSSASINFSNTPPSICVLSLDIVQLIMKYMVYEKHHELFGPTVAEFVMRHVLDSLQDDLFDQWLLNIISDSLDLSIPIDQIVAKQRDPLSTNAITASGAATVRKYLLLIKAGKITMADFMHTPWIAGRSYMDLITERLRQLRGIDARAAKYLSVVSEFHLIKLAVSIGSLYETSVSKKMFINIKRKLLSYDRMGVFSNIQNPRLKKLVAAEVAVLKSITA